MNIQNAHRYLVTLAPKGLPAEDVQAAEDAGLLTKIGLRAACAGHATRMAMDVTGMHVLEVVRTEPETAAA